MDKTLQNAVKVVSWQNARVWILDEIIQSLNGAHVWHRRPTEIWPEFQTINNVKLGFLLAKHKLQKCFIIWFKTNYRVYHLLSENCAQSSGEIIFELSFQCPKNVIVNMSEKSGFELHQVNVARADILQEVQVLVSADLFKGSDWFATLGTWIRNLFGAIGFIHFRLLWTKNNSHLSRTQNYSDKSWSDMRCF